MNNGVFTISLDFELYWGMRDKKTIDEYGRNLKGVRHAVKKILELFDSYDVHATWATVGFLFAKDLSELEKFFPELEPLYINDNLNPYTYIKNNTNLEGCYHFAPEIIDELLKHDNQEIGTHTFSHYYCLESGQDKIKFSHDIKSAVKIAKHKNVSLSSLVFPRNQWNKDYLSTLNKYGVICYRGNENGWLYKAVNETEESLLRRGLRLIDSYINITGSNTYDINSINAVKPYNIPSSRFLRPVSKRFLLYESLRKKRILNSIQQAAKEHQVFHLWWHPHNFGINTQDNLDFLEDILIFYSKMKKEYGMQSLNMGEIGYYISKVKDNEKN